MSRARGRSRMLALDPGLATCGWAVVELGPSVEDDRLIAGGVIVTKLPKKKLRGSVVDETVRRAREIGEQLARVRRMHGPFAVTAAECFSPPRSSVVAGQVGHAWGVIVEQCRAADETLLQCTPQEVKLSTVGTNSASKDAVIAFVRERFGWAADAIFSPIHPRLHEHAADAMAVQLTCADSDVVSLSR